MKLSAHFPVEADLNAAVEEIITNEYRSLTDEQIHTLRVEKQGSAAWHQGRRNRIGGSSIGGITGNSKYSNATKSAVKMVHGGEPPDSRMMMNCQWGTQTEDAVEASFRAALDGPMWNSMDELVPGTGALDYHIEHPGMFVTNQERYCIFNASPDGILVMTRDGVEAKRFLVEYKSPASRRFYESTPEHYNAQIHFYMGIIGLAACFFVVWVGGPEGQPTKSSGNALTMDGGGGVQVKLVEFDRDFFNSMIDEGNRWFRQVYMPNRILLKRNLLRRGVLLDYDYSETKGTTDDLAVTVPAEPLFDLDRAKVIVFDTETTGLTSTASIIQMAFIALDDSGETIAERCELFQLAPGAVIDQRAYETHRISEAKCNEEGSDPRTFLVNFVQSVQALIARGGNVVAHNYKFDMRMMNQTLAAWSLPHRKRVQKMPPTTAPQVICTCKLCRPHMKKLGLLSNNKALHEYLVGPLDDSNLHDALEDTRVTTASYRAGKERGWW
tara:strand:- start:3268 stop:4758 length:1491 start_codon:yes stop_codon:yes gene_type:complete